ncbi:MAG: hypothetical protein ACF8PN_06180 [Phycisphaerales bacterium]
MSVLAALGASVALSSSAVAFPLTNSADYRNTRDGVIVEPIPYPYARPRIVTKAAPASPFFEVVGPIYTRTPLYRDWGRNPGPAYYGAFPGTIAYTWARHGERPVLIDPFDRFDEGNVPAEFEKARRYWLLEHQYVGSARLVRKWTPEDFYGDAYDTDDDDDDLARGADGLPKPRAILRIEKVPAPKTTDDLPMQARVIGPNRVEIVSANLLTDDGVIDTGDERIVVASWSEER